MGKATIEDRAYREAARSDPPSDDPVRGHESGAAVQSELRAARQELETLHAALDNVQSGLLILDADLHVYYSNPALHRFFNVFTAEQIRRDRPHYVDLLRGAASVVNIDDYVARRLAWVKSGDPVPMDIKMANGQVYRTQIATLPDGGRMLIYSDVTDIVRNAQAMEHLATIDGMTGIYNRRHFLTLADREWERAKRYRRQLSLLMIDIDYFKAINDRFGHEIGDRAITHVANLAGGCKRTADVLARIGGEEFALLLPETDIAQAEAMAERLRCEVAQSPLAEVAHSATVSIGVATADDKMAGISDLMKMADHALYAAKRSGRNRVMRGPAKTESPPLAGADDIAAPPPNEPFSEPSFEEAT